MSNDARVLTEDAHGVRLISFNRPEVLNAFDGLQYEAVHNALVDALADDAVSVVVLTGVGRAFSAGADLAQMAERPAPEAPRPPAAGRNYFDLMLQVLERFDKPIIAAVNGVGIGIGCTILGHCDVVLMARGARLRMPFAPLGLAPEGGSTVLLPALIGWQKAARTLLTGDFISAEQALAWGMVAEICEDGATLDDAMALARQIADGPIETLKETKQLMLAARADSVAAARVRENAALARVSGSAANRQAVQRFFERAGAFSR
ncbi:MAG: Enoyl-CoA hydratase/isomerase [Pseudonocardiales bacterium]|nr:Enoyl-CoA hydratase/isomerase [Pseudonocardiales bacterium]